MLRQVARPQLTATATVDARRVATSIAEEIADLASAIEGSAFEFVAAAPERDRLPGAAQHFLASVQRLRVLHGKLVAFGNQAEPVAGTADLGEVVRSLTDELQHLRLGLELETELAAGLPPVAMGPEVARNALLFVCSAMFRAEPGATHLTITTEHGLAQDEPQLRVEILLEWVADPSSSMTPSAHESGVALALDAASRLVESHGGDVIMNRLPGRAIRTLVRVPTTIATERPGPATPRALPEPQPAPRQHDFGGALVVEADPDVRAMLAKELRAAGRAVFACADGTSARTFLEATPDRFELLIVDQHGRLDDGDALGETIRRLTPDLKICVLSRAGEPLAGTRAQDDWPDLRRIEKPFGVHELRQALASVLRA